MRHPPSFLYSFRFPQSSYFLCKEEVGNGNGGKDTCQVGKESTGYGMACVANADRAKIDGKDVKCRISRALEDAGKTTCKGVGSISGHRVNHHASCPRTGERFH